MSFLLPFAAVFLFGYLLGSIPFGLILTRMAGLGDIRKVGSGNIGATNVLRTGNKGLAVATLLLDGLKGTAAVWIGGMLFAALFLPSPEFARPASELALPFANAKWIAGLGAVVGHVLPAWLGFKGGKGVATYIGALIAADWLAAALFCAVWLFIAAVLRLSSLAALTAAIAVLAYILLTERVSVASSVVLALTVLIFVKHHANIRRLIAGEEPRIGAKA